MKYVNLNIISKGIRQKNLKTESKFKKYYTKINIILLKKPKKEDSKWISIKKNSKMFYITSSTNVAIKVMLEKQCYTN